MVVEAGYYGGIKDEEEVVVSIVGVFGDNVLPLDL